MKFSALPVYKHVVILQLIYSQTERSEDHNITNKKVNYNLSKLVLDKNRPMNVKD